MYANTGRHHTDEISKKEFHFVDEAEKSEETAMEVDKPAGDEQPTGESILWFLPDRHAFVLLTC